MSFWKKYFSKQPWWQVETDPTTGKRRVTDWNRAMMDVALKHTDFEGTAVEVINHYLELLDHKDSPKPWVVHQKGRPVAWNYAAIKEAAESSKVEHVSKEDVEEQRLLLERARQRETALGGITPFMQVNHYGFTEEGAVRLEMDWNRAFINHLRNYGFEGDEDLDVVKNYLESLTSKSPQDQLQESFAEIERWADRVEDGEGLLNAFEEKLKAVKRSRTRK